MGTSLEALVMMAAVGAITLAALSGYRWLQRNRVRAVKVWVKEYLIARDGTKPQHLNINCSDDQLWPVLVDYDNPRTGIRHRMQFHCQGPRSAFALVAEKEEKCVDLKQASGPGV